MDFSDYVAPGRNPRYTEFEDKSDV
jgi:hypothetical protein